MPVIHCISNFQGTSSKKSQDTANGSFFCFTSAFTSRYFLELLRLHSTSEKDFSFSTDSHTPTPHSLPIPPQWPKSAKFEKSCLSMLPQIYLQK